VARDSVSFAKDLIIREHGDFRSFEADTLSSIRSSLRLKKESKVLGPNLGFSHSVEN
jgi:hypothetical protein